MIIDCKYNIGDVVSFYAEPNDEVCYDKIESIHVDKINGELSFVYVMSKQYYIKEEKIIDKFFKVSYSM